jgi:hypothetical protein
VPAQPDHRDAVDRWTDNVVSSFIAGDLVKFADGKFIRASDKTPFDTDNADYIAHVDQLQVGYIQYQLGGAPLRAMGPIFDGFVVPARETLGDLDQGQWSVGLDGQPADPWQQTCYLPLENRVTAEVFTFTTSSKTGLRAIGNLAQHYKRMLRSTPDELPVVKLKSGGFKHRDERIGFVPTPVFAIMGKTSRDGAAKPDAELNDPIPQL